MNFVFAEELSRELLLAVRFYVKDHGVLNLDTHMLCTCRRELSVLLWNMLPIPINQILNQTVIIWNELEIAVGCVV